MGGGGGGKAKCRNLLLHVHIELIGFAIHELKLQYSWKLKWYDGREEGLSVKVDSP